MSKYNKNCRYCKFLVYGVPFIAIALVAAFIALYLNRLEAWLTLVVAVSIFLPLSFWAGKRMPMLHENFKELP